MLTAIAIGGLVLTLLGLGLKIAVGVSAYHSISQALSLDNMGQYKNFDQPVSDMLANSILLLSRFVDYVQFISVLFAFLCVVFTAFKLWSGTIEVKKAFVDMVYKCVMVTALILIWPSVITKTYSFASQIGIEASGGSTILTNSFASLASHTQKIVKEGTADYINLLKEGAKIENGTYKISENALKAFTDTGMTEDEAINWLKQNGVEVSSEVKATGFWIFGNSQYKAEKNAKAILERKDNEFIADLVGANGLNITSRTKYIKQNIAVLRAMSEILTGIPENSLGQVDISKILTMSEKSLNSVFYNPYVKGTDKRISVSTMVKTSIIMSKALADGCLAPFTDLSKFGEEDWSNLGDAVSKSKDLPLIMKLIGGIAKFVVYNLGMIICTILLMIEYSITLIEFLLVGAISTLLIPLFFLDATKQFVSNFIRMILTYFVKLMVTIMMIFFVMGMYLRLSESMYTRILSDTGSVVYYVFILLMGLVLAKSSGKIASAVISGNPSLGIGDIAHQMRGMSHAMHSGMRTVEGFGRDMQRVGAAGKKAAHEGAISSAANKSVLDGQEVAGRTTAEGMKAQRAGENYSYWNSDAGRAKLSDLQSRAKTNPQSLSEAEKSSLAQGERAMNLTDDKIQAEADKVGREYAKQARKQFAKDRMYHALTGMDAPADQNSIVRLGQQFRDSKGVWRPATWDDVQNAGKNGGDAWARQYREDRARRSFTGPDSPIEAPEIGR